MPIWTTGHSGGISRCSCGLSSWCRCSSLVVAKDNLAASSEVCAFDVAAVVSNGAVRLGVAHWVLSSASLLGPLGSVFFPAFLAAGGKRCHMKVGTCTSSNFFRAAPSISINSYFRNTGHPCSAGSTLPQPFSCICWKMHDICLAVASLRSGRLLYTCLYFATARPIMSAQRVMLLALLSNRIISAVSSSPCREY